jgi:hypothetical protein
MREGADVNYQPVMLDDQRRVIADFLIRVSVSSPVEGLRGPESRLCVKGGWDELRPG